MKRTRVMLPERTRLYLRACEILKVFDSENGQAKQEEEGIPPSSDAQVALEELTHENASLTESSASLSQSQVVP
jgi:hypothetical protein